MVKPSGEQKGYIDSPIDKHVYLEACPGSGKTEVVAAKVAKEILHWDRFPSSMAILSFSNSATDELRDRITKHNRHGASFYPHFIGTFDSFILKHIVSPVAHEVTGYAGKDGDYSIRVIESGSPVYIQTKYGVARKGEQRANQYDYDLCTEKYIFNTGVLANNRTLNTADLEDWVIKMLDETKRTFLEKGFATYRDVEHLAINILNNDRTKLYVNLIAKKFPLIIIDECQDLSYEQLVILENLIDLGVVLHLIGDLNQAIYGFRNAQPEKVNDFIQKHSMAKLPLTKNFRSGQQIVDVCKLFVQSEDVEGQDDFAENNCLVLEYNDSPTEVVPTFLDLSNKHPNRVIVARGYSTLNRLFNSAKKLNVVENLALAITQFDESDMSKIHISLTLFSEYLRDNHIKEHVKPQSFSCPESISSSLRWRNFLFLTIIHLISKGLNDTEMDWKRWCKLVKIELKALLNENFVDKSISDVLKKLVEVNHRAPSGKGNKPIGETLMLVTKQENENVKLATIHKVKGETYDATMLVSGARSGKESHWKDWIKNPDSEAARLAYVACSRPKHLLVLAIKKTTNEERKTLESRGFYYYEI